MDLPNQTDSRSLLINNAPDKFNNWLYSDWGTSKLSSSRIYGPVLAKRSVGTWSGQQLYIEVWPIQSKGWFLAQDSLKTQLIMDRY